MNETILVPVDFSENARVAAHYAASLASRRASDLYLLHAFPRFYSPLVSEDVSQQSEVQFTEVLQPKLDKLKQELRKAFPELHIDGTCIPGHLTDVATKLIAVGSYSLIVMGTKGSSDSEAVLIGSNTYDMITNAPIPVLAVPIDSELFEAQRVGMLTNYKKQELVGLRWFRQLVTGSFGLYLIHVAEEDASLEEGKMADWKEAILAGTDLKQVNSVMGSGPDLPKVINELIAAQHIDLLIVSNTKKSFFQALFCKSLVKSLAHRLTVPILFHAEHES